MSMPRLEIDLDKIGHNARTLTASLAAKHVSVTAVTKAVLGSPEIASVLMHAGVAGLGESRLENVEGMRRCGVTAPITLIRAPMLSQVERVISAADTSFNTELATVGALSLAATRAGRTHGVVLMVELGDLREGIMPNDIVMFARSALTFPNIRLEGLGTNLACHHGVIPDAKNMAELSTLVALVEANTQHRLTLVSGGNSANLSWALGPKCVGRINNLRLGEAILLGRDPISREPIDGLHINAITLVAEVIESKMKPTRPWGARGQNAFGELPEPLDRGEICQSILAIGQQDIHCRGLVPAAGYQVLAASSDHLMLDTGNALLAVGSILSFQPDYVTLMRAMTSPFVSKVYKPIKERQGALHSNSGCAD